MDVLFDWIFCRLPSEQTKALHLLRTFENTCQPQLPKDAPHFDACGLSMEHR